jgi:hypothetical protein
MLTGLLRQAGPQIGLDHLKDLLWLALDSDALDDVEQRT